MDALVTHTLHSADSTPSTPTGTLRLTPLGPGADGSFPLTHPYVELVYAPRLGPTAILIARYLGRILEGRDGPLDLDPLVLAHELGLRSSHGEVLGHRSHLRRSLNRLAHARIVRWIDDHHLSVHTALPPVSDRVRGQLPPAARQAHDIFVKRIGSRNGT